MTPTCRGSTRQSCALACVLVVLTTSLAATRPAPATAAMPVQPIPVLAYYYIWFNATSWTRAKTDLPLLGRYSSDESAVMRQHVRMAKSAGIAGFIVSWKNTPTLDRRLERLIAVANQSHFKLAVIYEGLDFERRPLAPNRVAADLDFFARRYANNPAFRVFDKPLVIWSGTWEFTRPQVANVTRTVRRHLLVLATEKDAAGYERVADVVDGDAYYWSSVNPETYPRYPKKLVDMGNAVHTKGGLWIAPAAVGFDARLVGGKTIVERRGGETLRTEMDGALASSPDAIGLISWNEFSENSHIEPSQKYGPRYLAVLADMLGKPAPSIPDFNSDALPVRGTSYGIPVVAGMVAVILGLVAMTFARRRPRQPQSQIERP